MRLKMGYGVGKGIYHVLYTIGKELWIGWTENKDVEWEMELWDWNIVGA